MKVAIHQPQYFPWFRYIQKILAADVFVYLDTVQFSKNGVQNRNEIKGPQGAQWITIPVKQKLGQSLTQTEIADPKSIVKHMRALAVNYAQAPGFARFKTELEELLTAKTYPTLCDVAIDTTEWMLKKLGAKTKRVRASEMEVTGEKNSALVAGLCSRLGATSYLTGTGALDYMRPEDFSKIQCQVDVQRYIDFEYPQMFSKAGFIPNLSTLDLLLNCPDEAKNLLESHCEWSPAWQEK